MKVGEEFAKLREHGLCNEDLATIASALRQLLSAVQKLEIDVGHLIETNALESEGLPMTGRTAVLGLQSVASAIARAKMMSEYASLGAGTTARGVREVVAKRKRAAKLRRKKK